MKGGTTFKRGLVMAVAILLLFSCRKDSSSGWNAQMLVPLVSSTLTLQNLVTDSNLKMNKDSSLTLAFQSTLYQFNLANEIVQIPDTSIGQKFNLDSLTLPSNSTTYDLSLGALATSLASQGNFLGTAIIAENESTASIPALSNVSIPAFSFNGAGFFDSAYVTSGQVQVEVVNHLPIEIQAGAIVNLYNTEYPNIIVASDTLTSPLCAWGTNCTGPNGPSSDSEQLKLIINPHNLFPGTFITNSLQMVITNLNTDAANNVYIDTADYIQMRIFLFNLHVSEAWAIFPAQSVVNQTDDVTVQFADRKLTYIEAKSGKLHITVLNSVPQPLTLKYTLVGAYNNLGKPLVEYTTVPAAVDSLHPGIVDSTLDISGYAINLTGHNGSEFNTYTQNVQANIVSNGQVEHITLADSLNIKYQLQGIEPSYIKGYVGRDTVISADSASFSFLNIFKSGTIGLQNVNMNFTATNDIGVGGQVKINRLTAFSSINNDSVQLSGSVVGQPLNITPATDFPLTPSINTLTLNNSNSNIGNMLGILPNKLLYNVRVQTNVNGNNGQYRQFAYLSSNLNIDLNAEIPLSLIANNLTLQDTVGFNISNANTSLNGINGGTLNIIVENKYPITANLTMVVYDSLYNPVDTILSNAQIAAAPLDNNCRVSQQQQTVIQKNVTQAYINQLKLGRNAVIYASFSTQSSNSTCNGQHLKIYSDYSIGVTLSAKFNYSVNTKF